MSAPAISKESIASRHARLYDRSQKRTFGEGLGRFALSFAIIGAILGSLYLFAR